MKRALLTQATAIAFLIVGVAISADIDALSSSPTRIFFTVLFFAVALGCCICEIYIVWRQQPKRYSGPNWQEEVRKYMIEVLTASGRCVMSSNDLSWATGDAKDVLIKKAKEGSLELLMPQENELSKELRELGAKTYFYGDANHRLKSRFTQVNSDRAGTWIAIGHGDKSGHVIREVKSNRDPVYFLVEDLCELARRLSNLKR